MRPLSIQKICSCGCLCAAAWAPAFMVHQTIMVLSPESTRRVIIGVTCSSEICLSEP